MEKNKSTYKPKASSKKQSNVKKLLIIGVAIISMVSIIGCSSGSNSSTDNTKNTASNSGNSDNNSSSSNKESNNEDTNKVTSNIVAGIDINKADISATAKFYPYESDGIKMEILALKAKDGTIRTALNTCQVCYASGKGYYVQEGDELVCQNCGNRFASNMVGKTKGGCNPVPISDTGKVDDGTKITIDKNYLDKNKAYFSNWKA